MQANQEKFKIVSSSRCFGGQQLVVSHRSVVLDCEMRFSLFLPEASDEQPCPVVLWLSGLTCTEQNFTTKSGFQREAAAHRVAVLAADTSPRGPGVADDASDALGQGAGFYVNATQEPWRAHYQMYDYVTRELPEFVAQSFPVLNRFSISGHSMGGHGALVAGLREPRRFISVSAFAPICAPTQVPWGQAAFATYLGQEQAAARDYDATALVAKQPRSDAILVDQGLADPFLSKQLRPELLEQAAGESGQLLEVRRHEGYDHGYYFISTFIADHLAFHAKRLYQK